MSTDTQSSAPDCPFPCGWKGLHKIAVQDAAYLAKVQWPEDEEGVSVPRATAMRSMDYLIQVCRTMLNSASVVAQAQQSTNCASCGEIKQTPLRIDAMGGYVCLTCVDKKLCSMLAQQPVSGADGLPTERVLIDGTAYELPAAVASELLRLHLEILGAEQERAALAQQDDGLFYKLGCFIDYATGGRLSKLNWSLATLKQSHDENLEALIAERMQEAKEDEQDADKVDAERMRKAIKDWFDLKEKISKSGRPPHADYWHRNIFDAENELRKSAIDAARKEQA